MSKTKFTAKHYLKWYEDMLLMRKFEERAGQFLQRLDALGDGRGGDVQLDRREVEGAAAVHGGKGGEPGGIKH